MGSTSGIQTGREEGCRLRPVRDSHRSHQSWQSWQSHQAWSAVRNRDAGPNPPQQSGSSGSSGGGSKSADGSSTRPHAPARTVSAAERNREGVAFRVGSHVGRDSA